MKVMQFSQQQVDIMHELQDEINALTIGPEWKKGNQDWKLAISVEVTELLEHWGWAWWKDHPHNVKECQTELIDCFHFLISYLETIDEHLSTWQFKISPMEDQEMQDCYKNLQQMLWNTSYLPHKIVQRELLDIAQLLGMTPTDIFYRFVGKNQLNILRQRHGYKQGLYSKIWFGEEDNVYLSRILDEAKAVQADVDPYTFKTWIYTELAHRYNAWTRARIVTQRD